MKNKGLLKIISILMMIVLANSIFVSAGVTKTKKPSIKATGKKPSTVKPAVDPLITTLQKAISQKSSEIIALNNKINTLQSQLVEQSKLTANAVQSSTDKLNEAYNYNISVLNKTIEDLKAQLTKKDADLAEAQDSYTKLKASIPDGTKVSVTGNAANGFTALSDVSNLDVVNGISLNIPNASKANVESICLLNNGDVIPARFTFNQNLLRIKPVTNFDSGATYNLNIYLKDGTKYSEKISTPEYVTFDNSVENVIMVPANPSKGFNYPYYIYVPGNMKNLSERRIMLETANTIPSDVQSVFNEDSKRYCSDGSYEKRIAKDLSIPLMSPAIPRYMSYTQTSYPQFMNRGALTYTGDGTYRTDLQVKAMIENAVKLLAFNGIKSSDKVFINGSSSSGKFAERFTILQPGNVMAISAGAIAGQTILPLTEYKGTALRFPVGIADYKQLTGDDFDSNAYFKIPQYLYMGIQDTNDATEWNDCFEQQDSQTIWALFGRDQIPTRWNNIQDLLKTVNPNAQCVTYANIGHAIDERMVMDIEKFYKANWNGGKLNSIIPITNY